MKETWRNTFKLHTQTEEYKNNVLEAKKIIQENLSEKCYIAFSGGKDSIVMTHLILMEKPDILVYHHDLKYIPEEFKCEIKNILEYLGVCNIEIRDGEEDLWKDIIPSFIERGYKKVFIGLRREESISRKFRISRNISLSSIQEVYPIQSWSWLDIWGYIVSNDIPYPSMYDIYAPVVGWDRVRFHTFFDPSMDKFGCSNLDGFLLYHLRYK